MKTLLLVVLFLASPAFSAPKHAPLPDAIVQAKSIYIDNRTGVQETTDYAYDALNKWGRFVVAQESSKADLIATFTVEEGLFKGTTTQSVKLVVTAKGAPDSLYEEVLMAKGFHLPNTRIALSAKDCVQAFEKRLKP